MTDDIVLCLLFTSNTISIVVSLQSYLTTLFQALDYYKSFQASVQILDKCYYPVDLHTPESIV